MESRVHTIFDNDGEQCDDVSFSGKKRLLDANALDDDDVDMEKGVSAKLGELPTSVGLDVAIGGDELSKLSVDLNTTASSMPIDFLNADDDEEKKEKKQASLQFVIRRACKKKVLKDIATQMRALTATKDLELNGLRNEMQSLKNSMAENKNKQDLVIKRYVLATSVLKHKRSSIK
jgi:hypothetical protein